jgi:outer membrane protein
MKSILICCLTFLFPVISAQVVLQEYIKQGLANNLALLQKETSYRQSLEALKEARGLFYPAVSINARYTVSEGGRVIDFPVGDLLNPVYTTLNQLTGSTEFPQVENMEIRFLRPTEQETKVRLIQPVFNTDLYYNAKIKKELTVSEEISLDQYKRELVAEIKKAYYSVGMSESLLAMLQKTRLLLLENVRVNTKLLENSKVTRDILLRAQTELSKFDQQMLVAVKNKQVSKAYFNFLLNKPLTDSVIIELPKDRIRSTGTVTDYTQQALNNREEIKNLNQYNHVSDLAISMNQMARLPNMLIVADYGYQGEKYAFNKDRDYLQASVMLTWDLFKGLQNRSKIQQALISKERVEHQLNEVKSRVELQVISALDEVKASEAGFTVAENQVMTAREGFRLVSRKYEEGQSNLIEFMDARSTLTQAEENLIISQFTCLVNYAEFEKVIAISKP